MTIEMFGGKRGRFANRRTPSQPWSTGVAASYCGGALLQETGALHTIDGIERQENDVDILKQHFKTSVRKLKLGRKWVFQIYNDTKNTSKVVAKGLLRTTKSRYWSGLHKALTTILLKICGQNCKSVCEQGGLQTWLSYTSSVRRNVPEITQLIVGSLWKATRNIWPKLNNCKAMQPNTNWVYVNFWPTRS